MNDLEQIIMEEIASLEDMRLVDVIGFIRYLKGEKPARQDWITGWFDSALESIRKREEELEITPKALERRAKKLHRK